MVMKCVACPNKYYPSTQITFHRFPRSVERCKQWISLCGRNDLIDVDPQVCNRLYKLCSDHFDKSQFIGNQLVPDALPSKFECYSNVKLKVTNECPKPLDSEPFRPMVEETNEPFYLEPITLGVVESPIMGTHIVTLVEELKQNRRPIPLQNICAEDEASSEDSSFYSNLKDIMAHIPKLERNKLQTKIIAMVTEEIINKFQNEIHHHAL